MEDLNVPELIENDNEFIANIQPNINNNDNIEINDGHKKIYNPASFQTEILIKYFQDMGILKKIVLYDKYNNICQLQNRSSRYYFKCH